MMLPSIRMGINVDADKAAAIEQWGSLAALKPELFINAHLRNPDTPASNADTPKASCSPQRQAIGEEEDAAEHDTKDFASALSSRVMQWARRIGILVSHGRAWCMPAMCVRLELRVH